MAETENGRKRGWMKYFKVAAGDANGQLSPISGRNQFGMPGYDRQNGYTGNTGTGNDFAFRNYVDSLCPIVINSQLAYFDQWHFSESYVKFLTPALEEKLKLTK